MEIVVRALQNSDIEALAEIESGTFSVPWSKKAFEELLEHPYYFYLVALANGQPVGCCGYTVSCGEACIDKVVVAEKHRNQGIASRMLTELIAAGERASVEAFTLEVRVSNTAAIHLYEKFGFHSEGIRPRFYEKPVEDAMIMWRRKTDTWTKKF